MLTFRKRQRPLLPRESGWSQMTFFPQHLPSIFSSSSFHKLIDSDTLPASGSLPCHRRSFVRFSERMGLNWSSPIRPWHPQGQLVPPVPSVSASNSSSTFSIHGSHKAGTDQGRGRGGGCSVLPHLRKLAAVFCSAIQRRLALF